MLGKPVDYKVPGLKIIYPTKTLRQVDDEHWVEQYRMGWKFYFDDYPYGTEYVIEEEELEYADWFVRNVLYPHAYYAYNLLKDNVR